MKLLAVSVNEFTPDFHSRGRSSRAVKGRAVATADHRRCAPKAALRFSGHRKGATPRIPYSMYVRVRVCTRLSGGGT